MQQNCIKNVHMPQRALLSITNWENMHCEPVYDSTVTLARMLLPQRDSMRPINGVSTELKLNGFLRRRQKRFSMISVCLKNKREDSILCYSALQHGLASFVVYRHLDTPTPFRRIKNHLIKHQGNLIRLCCIEKRDMLTQRQTIACPKRI